MATFCSRAWCALLLVLSFPLAAEPLLRAPLPIELAVGARDLKGEPVPSPDGNLIAYVIHNGAKRRPFAAPKPSWAHSASGTINVKAALELWILELDSGRSYALHPDAWASFSPSWSKDGKQLAFYSDQDGSLGLWVWTRGGESRRVTATHARPSQLDGAPVWIDEQRIFARFLPDGATAASIVDVIDPPPAPVGDKDAVTLRSKDDGFIFRRFYSDLGVVDLRTGTVDRVVEGKNIVNWSLAPDGSHVAFDDWVGSGIVDFVVVSLRDRQTKFTFEKARYSPKHDWSADSSRLYLEISFDPGHLTAEGPPRIERFVIDARTWKRTSAPKTVGPEKKRFDAPTGKYNRFAVPIPGSGDLIVDLADRYRHADLWLIRKGNPTPQRLTHLNPELDRYDVGEVIRVEWQDAQGRDLYGALLLPPGFEKGKRYPVHVDVYGTNKLDREFIAPGLGGWASPMWNYQVLSTRGYVVFKPIAPYGENTVLRDITDAVMSGVDKLVELGIADPDRLSVEGQSFGGYCVRALITQTDRFKAAISTAGTSGNVLPFYRTGYVQHRITADLYENRDVYIENSPIFFYDRVKTPFLVQLGLNDVGYWGDRDTEWDVRVLKQLGVEVELLEYEGEDHVIFGYANLVDFWNRRIEWIEKHSDPAKTQTSSQLSMSDPSLHMP